MSNAIITYLSDIQTCVESHGDYAVIRHEFSRKSDAFYTVRSLATRQDFGYSYRLLRNARRSCKRFAAWKAQD